MDQSPRDDRSDRECVGSQVGQVRSLKVLLFAGAAEVVGRRNVEVAIDLPSKVIHLKATMETHFPMLADYLARSRFAIDGCFVDHQTLITNHEVEVALIPPVSGG